MPTVELKQKSRRKKLVRFAEIKNMSNVFDIEYFKENKEIFKSKVTLELGCGKGDYTVGLARSYKDRFFIGVDRKGERIWRGAKTALDEKLLNVIFLRGNAALFLESLPEKSIEQIWITFPDPFPRRKQAKHRLTHANFLTKYKKILAPGGKMHLKTDHEDLYWYTLDAIAEADGKIQENIFDIYAQEDLQNQELLIKTAFEKKHLAKGKKIFYVSWTW